VLKISLHRHFKQGRPDTDFPDLLLLQSMNELDIGELNHGEKSFFPMLPQNNIKEALMMDNIITFQFLNC
jgi:hypothetical protein